MATFTKIDEHVSDKLQDGRRKFVVALQADNYNDTIITATAEAVLPWQFGKNCLITAVRAQYGATLGVTLYGLFYTSAWSSSVLRNVVTTATADYWTWEDNMDLYVKPFIGTLLAVYPVGYAATDDMILYIEGEVW